MNPKLKSILLSIDKPARYIGGEFNSAHIKSDAELNFLMCFPDVYEVGLSNLGIKILAGILNNRPDTACEMCFCPWHDFAEALKKENLPLFSLETKKDANKFDILGFSMQYELSITNVLYMLELSKIPLKRTERTENDPIILAGGPSAINPAPFSMFFDIFCIGDGEEVVDKLAELYVQNKRLGGGRDKFLQDAAKIEGVYVPKYTAGTVKRAIVKDLDKAYYPTRVAIPNIEAVHNRPALEVMRGCIRGCRFCQAGIIYRPQRNRSVETNKKYFKELIENNGFDEISLSSLSTCDYDGLKELLSEIEPIAREHSVNISLPSTRLDSFESEYAESARKSSLTFAPEAATQRLRDVINKNITEDDIFRSLEYAFKKGYHSIKLYFMIGLPTETTEDIEAIPTLATKIKRLYKETADSKKYLSLSMSASTFVPKPFTPFQWEKQISLDEIIQKQNYLKNTLKKMGVKFGWHNAQCSKIEAAVSRGAEKTGEIILKAYKNGCHFDGWTEHFNFENWNNAIIECGETVEALSGAIDVNSPLPWDIIDVGVTKAFLLKEQKQAYNAVTLEDCRTNCHGCGINTFMGQSKRC